MNLPNGPHAILAGAGTLGEQLAAHFAQRIGQRQLQAGARLPSVRDCARSHRVSPSTVVAAYDRLQAQGLVEARKQRGFFVRPSAAAPPPPQPGAAAAAALPVPVDAAALMRAMLRTRGTLPGPGLGTLPETWLDPSLLQRALRRAMTHDDVSLRYGEPAGDPQLRTALARKLSGELGIACTAEQVVTAVGATHALDMVARTLLKPGDAVLVDDPGWAVEHARLSRLGMRLLPVPRGPHGPDLAAMRERVASHRPRLYVTVSVLHNPTGSNLSLAAAHQVLQLAEAADLLLVEDDTYAWLAPGHAPRLAALDGLRRTVYVTGFSKILVPDWRVGALVAPRALVDGIVDTKLLSSLTTPAVLERAVAWCLEQGLLRRHAERVTTRLAAARTRVAKLATEAGCRFVAEPQGLFGWVDTGVDTEALAERLGAEGWLVAPGRLFHVPPRASTLMRVNFASSQDARFWRAFERARDALYASISGPQREPHPPAKL
ncbi:MAG: PLP-dependent aminotransferase family protein [Ideonella sp.]|nr:PLP-dependent aminotransferase family protein [Ideonella sp.]MCC7457356.1 PLP-dependent aminotransferase family protein [Nitrospira sp.]